MTQNPQILPGAALALLALLGSATAVLAQTAQLTVESPAFADHQPIPERNSAYGENLSPPLSWSGVPAGTRSLAVVLTDTSVPMPGGFVHWLIYNIPGNATGLPEGLPTNATLTNPDSLAGAMQGPAAMNNPGYFGPRPPAGNPAHHYVFTVYALDVDPDLPQGLNRGQLMEAIDGHILGEGQIMGIFQRNQ